MTALTGLPAASVPMPWHATVLEQLVSQFDTERFPHALLLTGPQYSGKSQLALALARRMLCTGGGPHNCGHCHACALSATGAHGDFRWVEPADNSRVIKVDQIRDAVEFATKTATFGARKIIVLHPADTMNLNACNALLKSLEEPAGDTYWLLVCHRLFTLPATIRSRCQIRCLGMPDETACLDWLDGSTGSRENSRALLNLSDGRPLLACRYYTAGNIEEIATRRRMLHALLSGLVPIPDLVALWGEEEPESFLQELVGDLQRLSSSIPLEQLRTGQGRAIFRVLDDVLQLQRAVGAGSNPGRQLLCEAILLKIRRELGGGQLGDTMLRYTGGDRVNG